jgi:hypothetical protein
VRSQATHYTGKWDCGMATEEHTPKGRGYDTSLFYFHHDNVSRLDRPASFLVGRITLHTRGQRHLRCLRWLG